MHIVAALTLAASSWSCASNKPNERETTPTTAAETTVVPPEPSRWLESDADFSSIVELARRDLPSQASGCLLAGPKDDEWYVGALFTSPLQPLPKVASDLFTQVMREGGSIVLLTQHGQLGSAGMSFVALTEIDVQPDDTPHVLAITPSGVFLRVVGKNKDQAPITLTDLGTVLTQDTISNNPLYVTADASTPLRVIAHALRAAMNGGATQVGFAVALPEGTRLPKVEPQTVSGLACGELKSDKADGNLNPTQIRNGLLPLKGEAQRCYDSLSYADQYTGATMLRVMISADGTVEEACIADDGPSAMIDRCLVQGAQRLRFPKPSPSGRVVFEAPFRFSPQPRAQPLAVCPASMVSR